MSVVMFAQSADGKYEVSYKPNVIIFDSGKVLWIPPAIYKSSCTINVEYFPFDQQTCEMKLGSWTFNSDQVTDWFLLTVTVTLLLLIGKKYESVDCICSCN